MPKQYLTGDLVTKMLNQLADVVNNCTEYRKHLSPKVQPVIPTELPQITWQKVAMDSFERKKKTYLLFVNTFALSRKLASTDTHQKNLLLFFRYILPDTVSRSLLRILSRHQSSYYTMGNRRAEKSVKGSRLLGKEKDP